MNDQDKTKEELLIGLKKLQQEYNSLKASYEKEITDSKEVEEETLRHSRELATLLRISQEFTTTLDLAKILQMTTDRVTELTDLKSSAIYLLEGETLRLWATTPPLPPLFPDELRNTPLADHPHIREAITTGLPVFLFDTAMADLTAAERTVCELRSLRSILYLPLHFGTQALGVLIVTASEEPHLLSEEEINLFNTFANLAALGVGNARLYESQKRYAREQENLVDELKQTEEARIKSERRYHDLFSQANEGLLIMTLDGQLSDLNRAFAEMHGYTVDELKNYDIRKLDVLGDKTLEDRADRIGRILAGEVVRFEVEHFHKDGHIFPLSVTVSLITIDDQLFFLAFHQDISERKQAEERLRKLNQAVEAAVEVVFMTDIEGIFTFVNPAFTQVYGHKADEVIGKLTPRILKSGVLDASVYQHFWQELIEHRVVSGELINKTKDGRNIHIWSSSSSILNDSGEVTGFLAIQNDITERKEEEEELLFIKKAVESTSDSIGISDAQGHHFYQNNALTDLFGYKTAEEMESLGGGAIVVKDPEVAKEMFGNIMSGKSWSGELEMVTKSGHVFPAYERADAIKDSEGKIVGLIGVITDITKRKQAAEDLMNNEKRFRNILETTMDGFWTISLNDGRFTEVNNTYCKMSGYSRTELLKLHISDIEALLTPDEQLATIQKVITNGWLLFETRHKRKDGSIFDVELSVTYQNNDGLLICFCRDITERKLAEMELIKAKEKTEENEKKYKCLFSNMMNAFSLIEMIFNEKGEPEDFIFLEVNPIWEKIVGISAESVIGKRIKEIMPNIEHAWINTYGRIILTGIPEEYLDYNAATQKYYNVFAYKHEGNQLAVVFSDVTDKKLAEIELKQEQTFIENILKGISDAFFSMDDNLVVNYFNAAAEKMLNRKADDVIGKYLFDAFSEAKGSIFDEKYHQAANEKIFVSFETYFDNEPYRNWYDVKVYPLSNGISVFFHVTTERKHNEIELIKAKEKAQESDRLKSAFLSNMSHEIRTPMNGILGFASLLKEPNLTGDEQQQYIRIIEKSGARMLNIINDIVDISKIEAGLMEVKLSESNINEQIEYIYTFFKPEMEAKGIRFSLKNTLPAKEAILTTDREKLYAILTNLVKNAIKYTNEGSIELGYFKKANHLEFYVKDTGIGVRKERQEAIFERFIQADIVDIMARQGAGLGLAITKSYVEMLGGKIWIESQEGIGSTFYFTLPYNSEPLIETIDQQIVPSGKTDNIRKLKILIAEDDEVSEMLIEKMVKTFGKEILKVRTGVEAVEASRNNPDIDLILMDIQMVEMGGYEATRQIRQFNKEVVIIAQTAFGLSGDREKIIEAGCNDYISKPIIKEKLLALIQKYFGI